MKQLHILAHNNPFAFPYSNQRSKKVTVILANGTRLIGEVLAVDSKTDLALIKVNTKLPAIKLAGEESMRLRPGQIVVAIGNNLGHHNTVTMGVISCTSRSMSPESIPYHERRRDKLLRTKYIQTDAAINSGNRKLFNLF